jgi:ribose transport system substrate-binding protein
VVLAPGGPHPYFQPWKDASAKARADSGLDDVTLNETAEWDRSEQSGVITSPAAQGYNAFGVFGVSPTDIDSTFAYLRSKGLPEMPRGPAKVLSRP